MRDIRRAPLQVAYRRECGLAPHLSQRVLGNVLAKSQASRIRLLPNTRLGQFEACYNWGMQPITGSNFGPLIAYLVPGAIALLGLSEFSPLLRSWFASTSATPPTLGGFLYLTVASLAMGMTVSALRWAVIDPLHRLTGVKFRTLDFSVLGDRFEAYNLLIKIHYEHYQFYSNGQVAIVVAYVCHRVAMGAHQRFGVFDMAVITIEVLFFFASRDTLRKYFLRASQLLSKSSV